MANIKDVARLAGVSVSTASRVVRGEGYTSEEVRVKVERAAGVNSRPTMYQGSSPRVYQRWSAKVYQARLGNRCETIELTGQVNRRLLKASGWLMYSHDRPC